jgi:hypothetical protein
MKQTILFSLIMLTMPVHVFACDSPTNVAVVVYCIECGSLCVPTETNCGEVAWAQVIGDKSNWGYVVGDGDSSCQETVTFAAAYSAIPDVAASCAGSTNAVPANRGDARVAINLRASAQVVKTNQFTIVITDVTGANISTNTRALYMWRAKPAGSD